MKHGITIRELLDACPWLKDHMVRYWIRIGRLTPLQEPSGDRIHPLILSRATAMELAQEQLHAERMGVRRGSLIEIDVGALNQALYESGRTQGDIAQDLGYSSRQSFTNRLRHIRRTGRMYDSELVRWAEMLSTEPSWLM